MNQTLLMHGKPISCRDIADTIFIDLARTNNDDSIKTFTKPL
jgi:hypothetical protein